MTGRHSAGRFSYYQALSQIVEANPSLYSESARLLSGPILHNAPQSLKLPVVVFLPDPAEPIDVPEAQMLRRIASDFLSLGHLCVLAHSLEQSVWDMAGVWSFALRHPRDAQMLLHHLGRLGHNLIVVSSAPAELNERLAQLENLTLLAGLHTGWEFPKNVSLQQIGPAVLAEMRFSDDLQLLHPGEIAAWLAERSRTLYGEKLIRLESLRKKQYELKKTISIDRPEPAAPIPSGALSIVIDCDDFRSQPLESLLASIREGGGARATQIVLAAAGEPPESAGPLSRLSERYRAELSLSPPHSEKVSHGSALNLALAMTNSSEVLFLHYDALLASDFFGAWLRYRTALGEAAIYCAQDLRVVSPSLPQTPIRPGDGTIAARLRPTGSCGAAQIYPRHWLRDVGGFCETEADPARVRAEMIQRAHLAGRPVFWLQPGGLYSQWSIPCARRRFAHAPEAEFRAHLINETRIVSHAAPHKTASSPLQTGSNPAISIEHDTALVEFSRLFQRATTRKDLIECICGWAQYCLARGMTDDALTILQDGEHLDPLHPTILELLTLAHLRAGALAEGGHYCLRALAIAPGNANLERILSEIHTVLKKS
jgi:hypothetical protein